MVSESNKRKYDKGMQLKNRGAYALARVVFKELIRLEPNSATIRVALADTYWKEDALDSAIKHFRRATELAPKWELASLGLFHCCWGLGRTDEAFAEMKRFMAISDSEDYRAIVKEINEKWNAE